MKLKLKIKFCFYRQMVTSDGTPRARPSGETSQGQGLGRIASLAQSLHAKSKGITKLNPIEAAA
ncbi:hypothetical protein QFZ20_003498 [Flavobacterium sp. W4I14]|nr:hypothetical protein [Flavobacterium sp. W4I14]